ncbi:C-4 sterol methyl oxidase [Colletotrichum tofieldiae]|nr:C-4 sterol methyl oxidase [Colletotrichum tofieldiae]
MAAFINSTVINTAFNHTQPYFSVFEEVSKYNVQLNYFERLWAAWYLWMQNDTLATGIMSFVMHETVYFGRSLPFIIFDLIPWFHKYKIQPQKMPTLKEQWDCAMVVLISHFTVELPQIWLFHPLATGYDFPWSLRHFLPFWAGADHHDLHHEKFIGNYASSFRWWDYCLDTEAGLEAHKKRREKKLKAIKAQKAQ